AQDNDTRHCAFFSFEKNDGVAASACRKFGAFLAAGRAVRLAPLVCRNWPAEPALEVGFAQGPGGLRQSRSLCYQPSRYPDDRGAFPVNSASLKSGALTSNRAQNLRRLLKPRHVCIVGGQAMEDSIRRCADTGFAGEIWVVNPKRSELGGRKCYP